MKPEDISMIRRILPEGLAFPYFADRESPWLLAQGMDAPACVADLRKGPHARFLDRPMVRPVVAACGGLLRPADLCAVAGASLALDGLSRPAAVGVTAAAALPWHDFWLTFADWGVNRSPDFMQLSRTGGNLVVQLGFPSDHAALMGRYLPRDGRKAHEFSLHPVAKTGRPTLAWARLDLELDAGVLLIEEVQSDWLRYAREEAAWLAREMPRSRDLALAQAYEAALRERYGRIWPRAMLLAVLMLARDEFGVREVWMHQPGPGAVLKGIRGAHPPVSLYSALPRFFGFEAVAGAPAFLEKPHRRTLRRLRRAGEPVFWRLPL